MAVDWKKISTTMRIHLMAQPRKSAALAVLVLVMLGVYGRLFLRKSVPTAAVAQELTLAPELLGGAAGAMPSAPTVVSPNFGAASRDTPGSPNDSPAAFVDIRHAPRVLTRDLFATDWNLFTAEDTNGGRFTSPEDEGVWQHLCRVAREQRARQRTSAAAIEKQSQRLTVSSTIIGCDPSAVVDGRILRIGDRIYGFEIVAIQSRQIIVRKDGISVIRKMR